MEESTPKEMRRKDRALSKEEAVALLNKAEYGVLSMAEAGGLPYGVPLNFCVIGNGIYFHCAVEGRKIEALTKNSAVSFCVVGDTRVLPEKFSTRYESVIVAGEAEEVFEAEKQAALEGLIRKYAPDLFEKGLVYIESAKNKTRVFRIAIASFAGKARR